MKTRMLVPLVAGAMVLAFAANAVAASNSILNKALKGAAIGFAVTQVAGPLDKFINSITLNKDMPSNYGTKVVPILSVGEKGYIGGAQVSGPKTLVNQCKAVFQYEDNFSNNEYRIKALVPSSSLNPIELKRVDKVGISALIDVSLSGGLKNQTSGAGIKAGDVLKAGAIAVAMKNLGPQINTVINKITFNKGNSTKVVPMASFGDKTYIGGAQVSASTSAIGKVNAVYQYEGIFQSGRFRVKGLVPMTSSNPLKMKRVQGAGITAVIDASLKRQQSAKDEEENYWRSRDTRNYNDRKDNGKHKGWVIGKHKGWYKNGKIDDLKADNNIKIEDIIKLKD
jgi:hypothetical protein